MTDLSAIDRGETPARTIRQLVSAIRQNTAGAGADMMTLRVLSERGEYGEPFMDALARLREHIVSIDQKATMALEAETAR